MSSVAETDFGKIVYEAQWQFTCIDHPRLGMRIARWDELRDNHQDEWRKVAKAVIVAFVAKAVNDVY